MKKVTFIDATSGIELNETGVFVSGADGYTLNPQEYGEWASHFGQTPSTPLEQLVSGGEVKVFDLIGTEIEPFQAIQYLGLSSTAFGIRFWSDPERPNGFVKKNLQEAMEELSNEGGRFRSSRVVYSRSGSVNTNTFLLNGTVPSNIAGGTIPSVITSAIISIIEISNQDISTFDISVFEHDGNEINLTLIKTYSIASSRTGEVLDGVTTLTPGKQIAVKLASGTAKNLLVSLTITGTIS